MKLFSDYSIDLRPPLKFDFNAAAIDAAENINTFLASKLVNFRRLLNHQHFRDQFVLKL